MKQFYPGEEVPSVYEVGFEQLKKDGIKGIIFDIDNTLVAHGVRADENIVALFDQLKNFDFRVCLLSNNKEERVSSFASQVKALYISDGKKPSKSGYYRAMELMGTKRENTIFIGDQVFTDIFGANRCQIRNILVKPIHPKEEIQIVLKRRLENLVLYFYRKKTR